MENTRAWAEINLDNIAHNMREIRRITNPDAKIMGVVKADAYGHGAVEVSKCILDNGADYLAVSQLDEALEIRLSGVLAPILILSDIEETRIPEIVAGDISQVVFTYDFAREISDVAVAMGKIAKIHIKLDTGMGRIGYRVSAMDENSIRDVVYAIREISELPNIQIEGLFTHFAVSDEPENEGSNDFTSKQIENFMKVAEMLDKEGIIIPLKHIANSAAILRFPEIHMTGVRAGIILYGLFPSDSMGKRYGKTCELRPAMSFKARISAIKRVPAGTSLSYGRTSVTERESVIATVPVGYADGYARAFGNKASVLVHGMRARVCGRVCMDQCMVDVTDLVASGEDIVPGDEVVMFGSQIWSHGDRKNEGNITVEELAEMHDTINYEILCAIGKRIPRKYIKNGEIVSISNTLLGN